MTPTVISVENLSKSYRLGTISTGTFYGDLKRWWAIQRGKPDPYLRIGESDHGNRDGETLWALQNINFTVKQGEALGIIGRNGAGKSTLLKILSQVTAPTSGLVNVKGRIASLLEVGTGFHPELTGRENIFMNGVIMGMSRIEINSKFDEIVDFSGVEKFIDTPVKRYSSGMYVRLAFAVAAHLDPDILIVDEVLAVGDYEFQQKCLGKIQDVAQGGHTVLFVSHNLTLMQQFCERCLLLNTGYVECDAPTAETIRKYANAFRTHDINAITSNSARRGNGSIRMTHLSFLDKNGDECLNLVTGDDIYIEFGYRIFHKMKGLSLTVAFKSAKTQSFIGQARYVLSNNVVEAGEEKHLTLKIKQLNLLPGEYPVYIQLADALEEPGDYDVLDDVVPPLVVIGKNDSEHARSYKYVGDIVFDAELASITKKGS